MKRVERRKGGAFAVTFEEAASNAMIDSLGPTGAHAVLFYLGTVNYDDVQDFHRKLGEVLGSGAYSMERIIVLRLARLVGLPASSVFPDDIVKTADLIRRMMETK